MSFIKNKVLLLCLALLTGIVFFTPLHLSAGKAEWQKAKEAFMEKCKDKKNSVRISVTADLIAGIYEEVEPEAVRLLVEQIGNEIARGGTGANTKEELINIKVINKCIEGLQNIRSGPAVKLLIKTASQSSLNWRVRFYVIKAMSLINNADVEDFLVDLINNNEPSIQIGALNALGNKGNARGIESACKLLTQSVPWEVKIAVAEYLQKLNSPDSIKYIRAALNDKNLELRVRSALVRLINELIQNAPEDANGGEGTKPFYAPEFYGIKVDTGRVVFIMDISGSMDWSTQETTPVTTGAPEKQVITGDTKDKPKTSTETYKKLQKRKEEVDSRKVTKRIESAKKELINTIFNLNPETAFSIIFYSSGYSTWKRELVPATDENKLNAIETVDKQSPAGATNIYDALEAAYKLTEGASSQNQSPKTVITGGKSLVQIISGADTIFLLTDGNPNAGKISEPNEIIEAIRKINETRKVKINTIAIGIPDPNNPQQGDGGANKELMRRIAEITGGEFVDKTR